MTKIGPYPFTFLSPIEPNEEFEGPGGIYCRFRVPDIALQGVYAIVAVNESVHYVGRTKAIGPLFNEGFGRPLDPDTSEVSGEELRRINRKIRDVWRGNYGLTDRVNLFFYATKHLEECLETIKEQVAPDWNDWETEEASATER